MCNKKELSIIIVMGMFVLFPLKGNAIFGSGSHRGFIRVCQKGDISCAKKMIDKGLDINSRDKEGRTLLHIATQNGRTDIMDLLLTMGANINEEDYQGNTDLHYAILNNHIEAIEFLLGCPNININANDHQGNTSLHLAINKSNVEAVRLLLNNQGIDVNKFNNRHIAPLRMAVNNEIDFLFEKHNSAHLTMVDDNRRNDILKLLINDPRIIIDSKVPYLSDAVNNGCVSNVNTLINDARIGVNTTYPGNKWRPPLHTACQNGYLDIVKELLSSPRVDVNLKDQEGMTALHRACQKGNLDIIKELLSSPNININLKDNSGTTAFYFAAEGEKETAHGIRHFIEDPSIVADLPLDIIFNDDYNLNSYADKKGSVDVIKYFIENLHIDANCEDDYGRTILHHAVYCGNKEVVKYLLEEQ